MFEEMKGRIVETTVESIFRVKQAKEDDREIERRQNGRWPSSASWARATPWRRPSPCTRTRRWEGTTPAPAGAAEIQEVPRRIGRM